MKKRIIRKLYTHERYVVKDNKIHCLENADGTLFYSRYKTKILPEDLPEWYVLADIISVSVICLQKA